MRGRCKEIAKGYYKGKYFLAFYDKNDEDLLYMFKNAEEILHFKKEKITYSNKNRTNVELYRALKRQGNFTRMLDGTLMRVYIIDVEDLEEDLNERGN